MPKSDMTGLHPIFIELRKKLGYEGENIGLCNFYTNKAIDAFLLEEYDTTFRTRCEYINENWLDIPEQLERAKKQIILKTDTPYSKEQLQEIFEVAAFFDQGELYQNPHKYKDVFEKVLLQGNQDIERFAGPDKLQTNPRTQLAAFEGFYSHPELVQYFTMMNAMAKDADTDFVLKLYGNIVQEKHTIAIAYSHHDKKWTFIDANRPFPMKIDDPQMLAMMIEASFSDYETRERLVHTQIITTENNKKYLEGHIHNLMNSTDFKNIHIVTPERAKKIRMVID